MNGPALPPGGLPPGMPPGLPPAAGAAPMMPPGMPPGAAPPAAMGGPQFPSLDPNYMANLVAPVAQQMQADQQQLEAQQQQVVGGLIDMMSQQPNPAAQAAMVEPGAPTSPLAPPPPGPDNAAMAPQGF